MNIYTHINHINISNINVIDTVPGHGAGTRRRNTALINNINSIHIHFNNVSINRMNIYTHINHTNMSNLNMIDTVPGHGAGKRRLLIIFNSIQYSYSF